jgi:hypothetical protein
MPQQESGRMRGFQLWINLPANEKMKPACYLDIQPDDIPFVRLDNGGTVKVIAGSANFDGQSVAGPIQGLTTAPIFLDVHLPAGESFTQLITEGHNAFVYPYEGKVLIGAKAEQRLLESQAVGVLSDGEYAEVSAGESPVSFLLLAARPLLEPIVQYGPFVMNTREEIDQAIADYQSGQLV